MSCEMCSLAVGQIVNLVSNGSCEDCREPVAYTGHATYIGLFHKGHCFRIHKTIKCPNCGDRKFYVWSACENGGYSEEFEEELIKLFQIKERITR